MIGARKEMPCGCVTDTIVDGKRRLIVPRCSVYRFIGNGHGDVRDLAPYYVHAYAEPRSFSRVCEDA